MKETINRLLAILMCFFIVLGLPVNAFAEGIGGPKVDISDSLFTEETISVEVIDREVTSEEIIGEEVANEDIGAEDIYEIEKETEEHSVINFDDVYTEKVTPKPETIDETDTEQGVIMEDTKGDLENPIIDISEANDEIKDSTDDENEEYKEWKLNHVQQQNSMMNNFSDDSTFFSLMDTAMYGNMIIDNRYLEIAVASSGRFTIGTKEGNPDSNLDDNKILLYGHPYPSTSTTTIRVDGRDCFFEADEITKTDDAIIATMNLDNLVIKQILAFAENEITGRDDIIKITYDIKNNSSVVKNVGNRIMLDTMLGDNDGAPFRIAGNPLTEEKELIGALIPQYWQVFDSLTNPQIIANGTVYKNIFEKPDKIQFADWRGIYGTLWEYQVSENHSFTHDSAVALYYNPKAISSGDSRIITTYYGIGTVSDAGNEHGKININVTAPQRLNADRESGNYKPNPFTVTAYVKNNKSEEICNTIATLNLPVNSHLSVVGDKSVAVQNILPNGEKTVTWRVLAAPQDTDKTLNYNITVSSTGNETIKKELSIFLPAILINQEGRISLNETTVTLDVDESTFLSASHSGLSGAVTWMSNNVSVAVVDNNGKVTAKSTGRAIISVSIGRKTATCIVNVTGRDSPSVQSISLSHNSLSLNGNETRQLNVNFNPSNVVNKRVIWTSSNPSVAAVTAGGKVTGKGLGNAVITAKTEVGNKTAQCNVTVSEPIHEIELPADISFQTNINGPSVTFLKKNFTLFSLPIATEITFPGEKASGIIKNKVKLKYDPVEQKFIATFGDFEGSNTQDDLEFRKDTYRRIKELMGMMGKSTNRQFYNKWRSLTKKSGPLVVSGNKTCFGYVAFVMNNNRLVLSEGEFGILGEAKLEYKTPTPIPAVFYKFGVTGDLQGGLKLKLKEIGNIGGGIIPYGNVNSSLGLGAAVGFDAFVANAYGGVEGKLKSRFDFPIYGGFNWQRDFELSSEFSAFLEYKAFMIWGDKKSWKFANFKHLPVSRSFDIMPQSSIEKIGFEDLKLIPRDNLNIPSQFTANKKTGMFTMGTSFDNPTIMKTNIFSNSKTGLYDLGDNKKMLLWIDDAGPARDSANRTALYYSVYDGVSNWSMPRIVSDDNTGDFDFDACVVGDEIYVVWQNADEIFYDSASVEEVAGKMGISVSKYLISEDKFSDAWNLTKNNDGLDAMPSIVGSTGSTVKVTWVSNTNDDITGETGSNILKTSVYNGDTWGATTDIYNTSTEVIRTIDTIFDGNIHKIAYSAYSLDNENNNGEIYLITSEGQPMQISTNNVDNANPKFVNRQGNIQLYWNLGDSIVFSENLSDNDIKIVMENANAVRGFDVLSKDAHISIIWENTEGHKTFINALLWDDTLSKWGNPIQLLKGYEGRLVGTSSFMESDGTMHISYLTAPLNDEIIEDVNSYGSSDLLYSRVRPGYNLAIEGEIIYDASLVRSGEEVPLNMIIKNIGCLTVYQLHVQLIDDNGNVLQTDIISKTIMPGESTEITYCYLLPQDMNKHNIRVRIMPCDGSNLLLEEDESDNSKAVTLGYANLKMGTLNSTGQGTVRNIKVDIENVGYDNTLDNVNMNLYFNDPNNGSNVWCQTLNMGALPAGSTNTANFIIDMTQFNFNDSSDDVLIEADIDCHSQDIQGSMSTTGIISNPYRGDVLTITSIGTTGSNLVFDVTNNIPEDINGNLLIQQENINSQNIVTFGQAITVNSMESETMEMDLSSFGATENSTMKIFVVNDQDIVISNVNTFVLNQEVVKYPLVLKANAGGSITSGESGNYEEGKIINIIATPNVGYKFTGWTATNGGVFANPNSSNTTFTMPGNETTVEANFTLKTTDQYTDDEEDRHEGTSGGSDRAKESADGSNLNHMKTNIDMAKPGDVIVVDMKSDNFISASILENLKDKDIDLVLNMGSYTWTINGKDVGNIPKNISNYNLKIETTSRANLSNIAEKKDIIQIVLAHDGKLPFTATLEIKVGTQYSNKQVFLYYYNETTKRLEYQLANTVNDNGKVVLKFSHASEYLLTTEILKGIVFRDSVDSELGSEVNSLVPFYIEEGERNIVKQSCVNGNHIIFSPPKTATYDYIVNKKDFKDIEGHWSEKNIEFVTAREIFNGIDINSFAPDATMTRGMFVTVLGRLYGVEESAYTPVTTFSDVDSNAWYAPYISWAIEKGIVNGIGNNLFAPDVAITREQMAVIIENYVRGMNVMLPTNSSEIIFADSQDIDSWAYNSVMAIQKAGIINGKPGQLFDPKGIATRAEISIVVRKLIVVMLMEGQYQ